MMFNDVNQTYFVNGTFTVLYYLAGMSICKVEIRKRFLTCDILTYILLSYSF